MSKPPAGGGKGGPRPPGVPKGIVLAKPGAPMVSPAEVGKPPVVRVAQPPQGKQPPQSPGGNSALISKDKLAYFKDNVVDSAEDFDPTDYYYHRDRELMAAGQQVTPGAPVSVVPGMPQQLSTAPAPGQKQILTHSAGHLSSQPVPTSSASVLPYTPPYGPASTTPPYGSVMPGSMGGRLVQPQILSGPPRAMPGLISSGGSLPGGIRGSVPVDPRQPGGQPARIPGISQPTVAMRGAQPMPVSSQILSNSTPLSVSALAGSAAVPQTAGGQRLLLRERSYSGNSSATVGGPRTQSSALPIATSPRGQQGNSLASGRPIATAPIPSSTAGFPPSPTGPSTVYSMGQKGGSAALNYQMNDNVVNRPLGEGKHGEDSLAFDVTDFPALSGRTSSASSSQGSEFSIQNEDFPALPGSTPPSYGKLLADEKEDQPMSASGGVANVPTNNTAAATGAGAMGLSQQFPSAQSSQQSLTLSSMNHAPAYTHSRTSSAATTPAPSSADRFGLLGLLSVIRMTDPDLNVLALGTDLTTLGLNLNSPEALYPSFASPWTDGTTMMRRYEPEYYLPLCYYMQAPMQPPQLKLPLFSDDTLFYIFYSMPKDMLQLAAAFELYNRDWRYHKELQRWFTRVQGTEPTLKTPTYERGSYIYYEFTTGDKMRKDNFTLVYDMLEERPQLPH